MNNWKDAWKEICFSFLIIGLLIFFIWFCFFLVNNFPVPLTETSQVSEVKFSIFDPDCSECNCLVHYSNDIWSIQNCECKKCNGTPESTIDVPYPFPLTVIP